jgi:hypothetical protein
MMRDPCAENAERRPLVKENAPWPHTGPTPSRDLACPRGHGVCGERNSALLG